MTDEKFKQLKRQCEIWWDSRPKFIKTLTDYCAYGTMTANKEEQLRAKGYEPLSTQDKNVFWEFRLKACEISLFVIYCKDPRKNSLDLTPTIALLEQGQDELDIIQMQLLWQFFCEMCDTDTIYFSWHYTFNGNDSGGWEFIKPKVQVLEITNKQKS